MSLPPIALSHQTMEYKSDLKEVQPSDSHQWLETDRSAMTEQPKDNPNMVLCQSNYKFEDTERKSCIDKLEPELSQLKDF